ncbi:MAG: hypothetical protein RLZZ129_2621 [Verrucomicrobiota bacterium]
MDAPVFFNTVAEIDRPRLRHWLRQARTIQWDYKGLIRRKGRLVRLN